MENLPIATLLVKNGSPSSSAYQLPQATLEGMGPEGHLPLIAGIWTGLMQNTHICIN